MPNSLTIWWGEEDWSYVRTFPLTVDVESLYIHEDFCDLCNYIEFNLGVLDSQGIDELEGFGTDAEGDDLTELLHRFEEYLTNKGYLDARHSS